MRSEERRPACPRNGALHDNQPTAPILGQPVEVRLDADLDAIAQHLNGAFVVVVEISGEPVKYRRRTYLSVAAAQRAVVRAGERGQNARVYLAELKPLYRVIGEGVNRGADRP